MLKRSLALMLSIAIALASPTIWAQAAPKFEDLTTEQKKELARLVDEAKGAYNRGNFAASLKLFQEAFDIYPHPDILYRMGLCYERLEEYAEAVRFYEMFLAQVPDAPERPRIEKIIESLSSRISKSKIVVTTVPEGAIVYVNDTTKPSGTTPTDFPVAPGTHLIIVKKVGYLPVEEQVTVQAGETMQLRYQLRKDRTASDGDTSATTADAGPDNTSTVITLAAVGIGATITSIVFFSLYSDKRAEVDELEAQDKQTVSRDRLEDAESAMYTNLAIGVVTGAVAAGTLLWAYLVWKDDSRRADVPAPTNAPVVGFGEGGWQVGWTWSF